MRWSLSIFYVRRVAEDILDELISCLDRLETVKRDRVLDSWVMSVEGDDVFHAHVDQFLKADRAVQGFTSRALVLAAFVEERHDDIDPAGLSSDSGNDSLQILKMIVRGHVVLVPEQGIVRL